MNSMRPRQDAAMKSLGELEAFIILDDLLNSLHKQYLDAKAQRKELVALGGQDDAMASVAFDMEDSAWCAMQTRYVELRAERKMMARAQDMMRRHERQIEARNRRIEKSYKRKQAHDFVNYLKILEAIKEKNRTPRIFEWLILFIIFRIDLTGGSLDRKTQNLAMAA